MKKQQTALILGATGGIGSEVARQLRDADWTVRAMKRNAPKDHEQKNSMTWVKGDALNLSDVQTAAENCNVIIHAVNPPGYKNWSGLVLPMLENTLTAAKKVGATIVLPGTVYNYGPDAFPVLSEDSPQQPLTRKGAIRVQMEKRLFDFTGEGGRVIIVRAGDFFGPRSGSNWFSQGLIKPGRPVNSIYNPADRGVGHQWSYLPDVARTMVQLLENRHGLDAFATFHLASHWDNDGTQMVEAIRSVVSKHSGKIPKVKPFPWWVLKLLTPFNETLREMMEMRYLWKQPVRMDNARISATLGQELITPLIEAVEESLKGLKCL